MTMVQNVAIIVLSEQMAVSEKERSLLLFIREKKYGTLTLDFQHGEPQVIREAITTTKL